MLRFSGTVNWIIVMFWCSSMPANGFQPRGGYYAYYFSDRCSTHCSTLSKFRGTLMPEDLRRIVRSCIRAESEAGRSTGVQECVPAAYTLTREAFLSGALLWLLKPTPSYARAGEPAKVKNIAEFASDVMGCQDERTNGCRDGRTDRSVYDIDSQKIMKERTVKVGKEWAKLKTQVDAALSQGDCGGARNALGLRLGTIKPQMREIARLASGGDVFVRPEAGAPASFDFRSGAFELKDVAQLPEDTFAAINRMDGLCRLKDAAGAAAEWAQAAAVFDQWFASVSGL